MIPERIKRALDLYATEHRPTGGFCRSVLENDLLDGVCHADEESFAALREIVRYVHCDLPSECHGSREAVMAWLNMHTHQTDIAG